VVGAALTGGGADDANLVARFADSFPKGAVICFAALVHLGLFAAWEFHNEGK